MLLQRLFAPPAAQAPGRALYAAAALQARRPEFYRAFVVADTVEGRFELYSLHVALVLIRLKGRGQFAAETAQHLFDAYVRALDDALREMGVSDVTVGKKMRKLGQAFYGRLKAYEDAIEHLPEAGELKALVLRTALEGQPDPAGERLAAYVARAASALDAQSLEDLLQGRVTWPDVTLEPPHG
ncbi:MAG TPA: ubiquinol-cytochrome C chaperone family protein [Caulobacteraceae bacterium]